MSAQLILGLEQNFFYSPLRKRRGNIQAQNGESLNRLASLQVPDYCCIIIVIIIKGNPVRKILSEVNKAYISGLLDGDGAIMACIEKHTEKKFGFRIRICIKISQNNFKILNWCKLITIMGNVRNIRNNEYEWLVRNQEDAKLLLELLIPYLKIKNKQAKLAQKILNTKIKTIKDLLKNAKLADALSRLNVRSQGRRKNFMTMIQDSISPND